MLTEPERHALRLALGEWAEEIGAWDLGDILAHQRRHPGTGEAVFSPAGDRMIDRFIGKVLPVVRRIIESEPADKAERVDRFLAEYKELCRKHDCCVLSQGEQVEAAYKPEVARDDDPWGVEALTLELRKYDQDEPPEDQGQPGHGT